MKLDPYLAQLVFEHLDGAAVTDPDGKYLYVNKGWLEMTGKKADEVYGEYIWDIVPQTKMKTVLETQKPLTGEIITKNTKGLPSVVSYIPIMEEGRLVAGLVFNIFKNSELMHDFKKKYDRLAAENDYYRKEMSKIRGSRYSIDNIIGNSSAISKLKVQIKQAARSNSTVLIEGETGTGKELVAHAIHSASQRGENSFIKVNCAAIPNDLLEAELFGYEEGSFTGAKKGGKPGKFELANLGSIFLDEINQLPVQLQPKLLRTLQEQEVDRVGGRESVMINVRIITASNVPLEKLVAENRFRSDLYYRINVIQITLPPLRERKEDIPLLVEDFIKRLNFQLGINVKTISSEAMNALMKYDWPGNVRELHNVIERAMNESWDEVLEAKHFEWLINNRGRKASASSFHDTNSLKAIIKNTEKQVILEALREYNGNKTRVAKELRISRTVLYDKLREFNLV